MVMSFDGHYYNAPTKYVQTPIANEDPRLVVLKIDSVARGLLRPIFQAREKIRHFRTLTLGHSQVLLEIKSVARRLLRSIL